MPQHASRIPAEDVSNFCSSECVRELASFCPCTHHYWNGDDVVLAGRDRSTAGDALHDSTRCFLKEGNLAIEI